MSRGLGISRLGAPIMNGIKQFALRANTWYSGSAVTTTSPLASSTGASHAVICCRLAIMLRWVSIAPLGTPVVPPVYCRKARSVGSTSATSACAPRAERERPLNRTACGSRHAGTALLDVAQHEIDERARAAAQQVADAGDDDVLDRRARRATSRSMLAKFSSTTIASAPESASWW